MKPIIAINLVGVLVRDEPWRLAKEKWFKDMAKELGRSDILELARDERCYGYEDEIMLLAHLGLPENQRIKKIRESYFEYVKREIEQVSKHILYKERIDFLKDFKDEYRIGLISTQSKEMVDWVLDIFNLKNFFDVIECTNSSEKISKDNLYYRFVKNHGIPFVYVDEKCSYDGFIRKLDCLQ